MRVIWLLVIVGASGFPPAFGAGPNGRASSQGTDLIGAMRTVVISGSETLAGLALEHGLGFVELLAANPGVDPWVPEPGTEVVLPLAHVLPNAPRRGIVINLAEQRLYYFPRDEGSVRSFAIGPGGCGHETPLGETSIIRKQIDPSWTPPASILEERPGLPRVIPPGPNNPLGKHALYLGWPTYIIHGTNKPLGIGRRVSHGCVRMYPEDIAWLFTNVFLGTPVSVVDQPIKIGWRDGELYLEVHPTQLQADAIEAGDEPPPDPLRELEWRVFSAAGPEADRLDWPHIQATARERRGVPIRVTR